MGVLDKIKNALFEVEYVEVEDKPKKEKKHKSNEHDEEPVENEKPIAKKIVLPGKREEKVEEIQEEELKDEDFEVRPKDEKVKEVFQDNFNVMDDDDFTPPETPKEEVSQPVVVEETVTPVAPPPDSIAAQPEPIYQEPTYADKDYVREYDSYKEKVYSTIRDDYRVKTRESKPYGMDPSYQVSIKEYGGDNRDEKGYFKPSPIISPIYGILDKNYRKEDVVSKKEVHLTSSYARANVSLDDIRDKAYGKKEEGINEHVPEMPKTTPHIFEVEKDDENLLVDLTDEKKPEVKEITVGDAMEYYHDLGLEYNVDYVDASNKNPKKKTDDLEEEIKDTIDNSPEVEEEPVIEKTMEISPEEIAVPVTEPVVEEPVKEEKVAEEKPMEQPVVEEKEEPAKEATIDDDDNLFDLIDSMYKEEDN